MANLLVRMAWRNIWRNRRRTIITMSSIVLAIVLSVVMRSMQLGSYAKMIDDVVGTYTGHLQVHKKGYWDDKSIDNSFAAPDSLMAALAAVRGVAAVIPRFESFALAAGKDRSRGVFTIGIAPQKEDAFSKLRKRLVRGDFLKENDNGVLMAEGLARFLALDVGDSLVLLGQGYHGASAAGTFAIRGIVSFASPELNRTFMYLTCSAAQYLFGANNRLTSAVIEPAQPKQTDRLAHSLAALAGERNLEVLTWRDMLPELMQQIHGDNAGGLIMLGILYMIVAFGIFGTILMMTTERVREFGVVNALGLSSGNLAAMVGIETTLLSLLSALAGSCIALPIVLHFNANPIQLTGEAARAMINFGVEPVIAFLLDGRIFMAQILIVLAVTAAATLYPLLLLRNLNPVAAMRK
jgi:putative ABC transport system permease protein